MSLSPRVHLLVFGTDPESKRGGIAFALPGFFVALESAKLTYDFIPTHLAGPVNGKWQPWIKSFGLARYAINSAISREYLPVAYIHMGGGIVSCIRKSILARFLSRLSVPVVIQIHSQESENYYNSSVKRYLFNKCCLEAATAIAVLTPWCARIIARNNYNKIVYVVPNALNNNLTDTANSPRISIPEKNYRIVLAMSRLVKGKGFDLIVEALPYLPAGIIVEIAGAGPLKSKLEKRILELGQTHKVRFLGWLNQEGKAAAFSRAEVFCLPSQYDSFGMGYIEAMAHGLPIVALKYGPIPDVVPDGKCGILINKPDPKLLAKALCDLLKKDINQSKIMEKMAKFWVLDKFSHNTVGTKVLQLCDLVLDKSKSRDTD